MKRVLMLRDVKDDGQYFKDEVRVLTPEKAGYFCAVGWARDLSGELATGDPDLTEKTLTIARGNHGTTSTIPGAT